MGRKIADRHEWEHSLAVEIYDNVMPIKRKISFEEVATKLIEI